MSVIIRLQGLSWSASAMDIRQFFKGLSIPPGGVHIIGGEKGDAFIAFVSDEDARRAMMMNNGVIDGNSVQLFLSSKTEMQNIIGEARNQSTSAPIEQSPAQLQPPPQPYMSDYSKPQNFPPQERFDRGYNRPNEEYNHPQYQQMNISGAPEDDRLMQNQRPPDDLSNRYEDRMAFQQNIPSQPLQRESISSDKRYPPPETSKESYMQPQLRSRDEYERFGSPSQELIPEAVRYGHGQDRIVLGARDGHPDRYGLTGRDTSQEYSSFPTRDQEKFVAPKGDGSDGYEQHVKEVHADRFLPRLDQSFPSNDRNVSVPLESDENNRNRRSQDSPLVNMERKVDIETPYPPYPQQQLVSDHQGWETPKQIPGDDRRQQPFDPAIKSSSFPQDFQPTARYPPDTRYPLLQSQSPFSESQRPYEQRPFDYDGKNQDSLRGDYANRPPHDGKNQDSLHGDYGNRPPHEGKYQDSLHGDYANRPPYDMKNRDSLHSDFANRPPYDVKYQDSLHGHYTNMPPHEGKNQERFHGDYANRPPHEGKYQDSLHGDYANRPHHDGKIQESVHTDFANRPLYDGKNQDGLHADFAKRPPPPFSLQERERDMYPSPLDRKQKDLPNNSLYNPDIFSRDQHIYRRHPEDVISSLASSEQTRSSDSNDKFENTLHARRSTGLLETPNPQLRFSDRNQFETGENKFPNQQQGGVSSSENRKASDENEPPPFWNPQEYEKTENIHQMPPNFNVPPPKGFDGKPPVSADHLIHIDGRNEYPPSYPPRPPQDMFNRPPPGFMEKPVVDRPPYPERPSYEFSQKKPFEYPNSDNRPPFSYGDAQPQGYERSNTADYSERNLREERRPPFNFDERSQLDTDKDKFNNDAPKQHEHIGKDLLGTQLGVPSTLNLNVDTRFANRSTPIAVPNNDNPPLRYGAPSFPNPIDIQKRPPFRDENIPVNFSSQMMNVPFRPAVPDSKNIPPLIPEIVSDPDLRRSGPAQQVFAESKGLSQKTNNHRTDGVAGADKKSQDIDKREDHQRSTERTIDIDTRGQKNSDRERLTRLDVDNRQRRDVDGRADVDRRDRERDRERDNRDRRREVTDRYNRDDRSRSDVDRRRNDNDRRDERQRDRGRDYDRSRDFDRSRDYDRFRDYDRSRIDRDRDRDSRYDSRYRDDRDSRRSPRNRDKTTDEFGRDIKPDKETRREQSSSEKNLQNKVIQPAQPDKTNNDSFKNTFSEVSKQIPPPRSVSSNVSSQKNNTSLQSIPIPSSPQQAVAGRSSSSTVFVSPVTSSINPQQLHSVSLSSASKSSAPTSSGVRISGSGTTVAKSTPVINTSPSGPRPLTGTAVTNFRPAVSTIGNQRVDPSTLPGLLGAAPPGVRPILMSNPQMLSISKRKSDLEPKGKSASTPEASIKNTPPQTLPTSSSAPIVAPKVVDADDPKGLKRQYRQATPSLTIVVKNLPLNSGYRDVRKFFQGCEIPWDGLKMINDEHGKRIGVAYINFCSSQAYFESIEKNGKKMNENTIEVKPCKQDEYDKAVDSYIPSKENEAKKPKLEEPTQPKTSPSKVMTKDFVIQVKGWAQCVNKDELKRFFKDMKISNNGDGIYIEHDQQKRPTGMAMLKFEKEVDYIRALGMDLRQVAGKTVHIKSATQKELDDMKQSKNQIGNKTENTDLKSASGDAPKCEFTCVHLQGLPPYITSKDLQYTLFNGLEFGNRGIQLVQDSNGKPLGEAFAEFISESECARALKKDGEILMRKQVIVKPILKTEMLDLLRMIKQPTGRLSSGSQYGRRSTYYVKTENWPFTISIREVISFFQGFNPIQETVRVQIGNDMQGSAAMVGFRSQEDADRAVKSLNNKYYRQRAIRMEPALM